jgi:hypothetical protein
LKPLDAAIGRVLASHRHGGCHGRRFWLKTQNINKKRFFASQPMLDRSQNLVIILGPEADPLLTSSIQQAS